VQKKLQELFSGSKPLHLSLGRPRLGVVGRRAKLSDWFSRRSRQTAQYKTALSGGESCLRTLKGRPWQNWIGLPRSDRDYQTDTSLSQRSHNEIEASMLGEEGLRMRMKKRSGLLITRWRRLQACRIARHRDTPTGCTQIRGTIRPCSSLL